MYVYIPTCINTLLHTCTYIYRERYTYMYTHFVAYMVILEIECFMLTYYVLLLLLNNLGWCLIFLGFTYFV